MTADRSETTAYHEAGHAVVAHALGLRVETVSVLEDEESLGRASIPLPEGFQPDDQGEGSVDLMERQLTATLAGAAAQRMFTGEDADLGGNDERGALSLLMSLGETSEEMSAVADAADGRAEAILREEWVAVEALAERLLEAGELTGYQAIASIERS